MATTEQVPETYDEAVRLLAEWQADVVSEDLRIYTSEDPQREVVRLIEVSDDFPDWGGVHTYRFGRSAEFPFRSAVALVPTKYWPRIEAGEGLLPADWQRPFKQVWPPVMP